MVLAWYWQGHLAGSLGMVLAWYWHGTGMALAWVHAALTTPGPQCNMHMHMRMHVCGACTLSTETRGAGVRLTAGEAAASRARPDGVRPRIAG